MNAVTPGWFATYRTALIAGRDFDARDGKGTPRVLIVNEAFVRRFVGAAAPLGGSWTRRPSPAATTAARDRGSREGRRVPLAARRGRAHRVRADGAAAERGQLALCEPRRARERGLAGAPQPVADGRIGRVDPKLSLTFKLLSDQVGAAMMRERIVAMLSGFFGFLALFLAGLGLYGVTSHAVNRRRTEIGVRIALGADSRGVVRLVLGRASRLIAVGVVAGVVISLLLSRFVEALLFGLPPRDPATLAGAAAVLVGVGLLAAGLPARRASRIDPAQVLREG